jgi:glycosyltransferase involved in cell wall biosynthesis
MLRVAWFSPLPPARSGIADYSAELLPALAEHLHLELYVEDGFKVERSLADRFAVRGYRAFAALAESYDAVVYHLGNNADYHAGIYRRLLDHPGIVVLHEYVLHHLVRGMTLVQGDLAGYLDEVRYAYGRTGESLARRNVAKGIPLDVWSFPLFERAVDRSLGLLVHNDFTAQKVLASRPGTRIARVPHHLCLGEGEGGDAEGGRSVAAVRAELGIPAGAFVVASFGFITPSKRLDVALRAFARVKARVPHAVYLLVGEVSPYYDFASVLSPELAAGVTVVGRTEIDRFLLTMRAVDVAVNLRHPTAGETSGTLIRLLGTGKPVIVSENGAFAEIPDGCCAKVPLGELEEELLAATLIRLAEDEALRHEMGENARRHTAAHHTLAGSARGYAELIREVVEAKARPFVAVPPLAPYPPDDVLTDLLRDVAAEAVDLGAGQEDDLLAALARVVVELGLDQAGRSGRAAPPAEGGRR